MKKLCLVLAGFGLLAGCDEATMATIPGTDQFQARQAEVTAWEQAVATVKCTLATESQYLPVELQAGLSRERVSEILGQKIAAGEAVALSDGGYRYIAGPCTPAPTQTAAAPAAAG